MVTKEEEKKAIVLQKHLDGLLTIKEVSELVGLSERQVYRLKKKYSSGQIQAITHKNRGKQCSFRIPDNVREGVVSKYKEKEYSNSNFTHFTELFNELSGHNLSVTTVRRILSEEGLKSPKKHKRRRKVHSRRERKAQRGMLTQLDGSPHNWLGTEYEKFTLMAAIDDATSIVEGACFRPTEDLQGYLEIAKQVITRNGIPMAFYTDKHTILRSPKEEDLSIEEQLEGVEALSQFGKGCKELGIEHIKANSPQAKGRIERLFNTLQDRLVTELKIRGITSIDEANKVLPELIDKHNAMFAVKPKDPESAYVPLPGNKSIDQILCFRPGTRKVDNGNAFSLHNQYFVIDSTEYICNQTVNVLETTTGEIFVVLNNGTVLPAKECANYKKPRKKTEQKENAVKPPAKADTVYTHWRKFTPNKAFKSELELRLYQKWQKVKAAKAKAKETIKS